MIFRGEHSFAYYLWNGDFPVLIHLPPGTDANPYYWMGLSSTDVPEKEKKALNDVMLSKKRVFELPTRPKQRFVVENRGVFVEE
jgi:hypothetical protein